MKTPTVGFFRTLEGSFPTTEEQERFGTFAFLQALENARIRYSAIFGLLVVLVAFVAQGYVPVLHHYNLILVFAFLRFSIDLFIVWRLAGYRKAYILKRQIVLGFLILVVAIYGAVAAMSLISQLLL